jgi:CRISPR/Cas system-associated exonuclease Cas4 (RecB family)
MLEDYVDCKRKAWFHKEGYETEDTASLILGRNVHNMIEAEANGEDNVLKKYRDKLARQLDNTDIKFYRGQYIGKLLKTLNKCYYNYLAIDEKLAPVIASEERFSIPYDDGVKVVGVFDQLRDGNIIMEWKSSRKKPKEVYLKADLQATVYTWAYMQTHKQKPKFYYVHLRSGGVYEVIREDFSLMHRLFEEYIRDFRNNEWTKQRSARKCQYCWYNGYCFEDGEGSELLFSAVGSPKKRKSKSSIDFFSY